MGVGVGGWVHERTTPILQVTISITATVDIENDFKMAYKGILKLPVKARFGVYVAYKYYLSLFKKIQQSKPKMLLEQRIRIPNHSKYFIVMKAVLRSQLNIL
jgi:hypothetical protein